MTLKEVDANGSLKASSTAIRNADGSSNVALRIGNQFGYLSLPKRDAIHVGDNVTSAGEVIHINADGSAATAFVGRDGLTYTMVATPKPNGDYLMSVTRSDGQSFSQRIPLGSMSISGRSIAGNLRSEQTACHAITDGLGYGFGILSGAAWIVAEVGYVPAGIVAASSALVSISAFAYGRYLC